MKQSGEINPIKTHIKVSVEKTGVDYISKNDEGEVTEDTERDYSIIELDDILEGGSYPGDFIVLVGETNVGKSMALMEFAYSAAMNDKKNVVLFTIEMNKVKQQTRIYSRMTGIEYHKFRTGKISKDEIKHWKCKLREWRDNCGMLYVVSFDSGATTKDIENKLYDIQNRTGKQIDFCVIDYLNDITPIGKFESERDWTAMGSVSWALANLAKNFNNHKGIPILSANQRKESKSDSLVEWSDTMYGKIVIQHSTVGIGITQTKEDKVFGRLTCNIFKNRDGGRGAIFYVFPNFSIAKFSSLKSMQQFYGGRMVESDEI
jgi:replicative DNA helicase